MTVPRSRPPGRIRAIPAVMLVLVAAACGEAGPIDPLSVQAPAFAAVPATTVCHAGPAGYRPMAVNAHAVAGHRAHGDPLPGELVPGLAGYEFGPDCEPIAIVGVNGTWTGTYAWDCLNGLHGSSPLTFVLTDDETGRISGTASYLGGSGPLRYDSYRLVDPEFRANGSFYGGTLHPDGLFLMLQVDAVEGAFQYNEFFGTIDLQSGAITGVTLNGDSPTPFSPGCSSGLGNSGTFSVARVN